MGKKNNDKEYLKKYYRENKEILKQKQNERYRNNEEFREQKKKHYQENKERISKRNKERYLERNKGKKRRIYRKGLTEEEKKILNKENTKKWRLKNKEKVKKSNDFYNKKKKVERNKKKEKKVIRPNKNYILDSKLRYQIILSQGMGEATHKLKLMLYDICENLNKKFYYQDSDMRYDIMMNSYVDILEGWGNFDSEKYKKALPFVSEIVKRSHAKWFNNHMGKGIKHHNKNIKIDFESIDY